jgi:hypothetical protein
MSAAVLRKKQTSSKGVISSLGLVISNLQRKALISRLSHYKGFAKLVFYEAV